ncbi:MAG: hypothetical protein ACRD3W_22905 [Terriglobales bacterium]
MLLFCIKVLTTPLLIAAVTLAERKYGPRATGMLIGLPLTSGPVSLFLATEQGADFSSRAAIGTIGGIIAAGAFSVAYVYTAKYSSWWWSLIASMAAFSIVVLPLPIDSMSLPRLLIMAIATLALSWTAIDRISKQRNRALTEVEPSSSGESSLALRMIIATVMVTLLTWSASHLGPQLSGVLSSVPVISAVLAAFIHVRQGSDAAINMVRGLVIGCFPALAFYAMIASMLKFEPVGITYTMATVATLSLSALFAVLSDPRNQATVRDSIRQRFI